MMLQYFLETQTGAENNTVSVKVRVWIDEMFVKRNIHETPTRTDTSTFMQFEFEVWVCFI